VKVIVEAELALEEPTVDHGLVTWFTARVLDEEERAVAHARVARVHVGMASDVGEPLADVLDADSAELEALYGVYFEEDWFRQQFTEGAGSDRFYISEVAVAWCVRTMGRVFVC